MTVRMLSELALGRLQALPFSPTVVDSIKGLEGTKFHLGRTTEDRSELPSLPLAGCSAGGQRQNLRCPRGPPALSWVECEDTPDVQTFYAKKRK